MARSTKALSPLREPLFNFLLLFSCFCVAVSRFWVMVLGWVPISVLSSCKFCRGCGLYIVF